jgi:hypothetical protein
MTQDDDEQISRTLAAGNSRRKILRALGVVGASGLLAVAGLEVMAGERPHQRLQGRTPQRNRKQRNKNNNNNQNNNSNNNQNTNGGGGLGSIFGLGTSLSFHNQSTVTFWVQIPASGQGLWCGPGFSGTLDAGDEAVTFVINYSPQWSGSLHIGAFNPDIGEPWVEFGREGACDSSDPQHVEDCYDHHPLSVGESFQFDWGGAPDGVEQRSFKAERQSDSSDYKMFLITALA